MTQKIGPREMQLRQLTERNYTERSKPQIVKNLRQQVDAIPAKKISKKKKKL